jgi:hypothetical protein
MINLILRFASPRLISSHLSLSLSLSPQILRPQGGRDPSGWEAAPDSQVERCSARNRSAFGAIYFSHLI